MEERILLSLRKKDVERLANGDASLHAANVAVMALRRTEPIEDARMPPWKRWRQKPPTHEERRAGLVWWGWRPDKPTHDDWDASFVYAIVDLDNGSQPGPLYADVRRELVPVGSRKLRGWWRPAFAREE